MKAAELKATDLSPKSRPRSKSDRFTRPTRKQVVDVYKQVWLIFENLANMQMYQIRNMRFSIYQFAFFVDIWSNLCFSGGIWLAPRSNWEDKAKIPEIKIYPCSVKKWWKFDWNPCQPSKAQKFWAAWEVKKSSIWSPTSNTLVELPHETDEKCYQQFKHLQCGNQETKTPPLHWPRIT